MTKKEVVKLKINGKDREALAEPRLLLVHFIREALGLTGTHVGCDTSNCGACTVIVNGKPVKSCTMFAVQADGAEVMTVEGLIKDGALHPLQEGFKEEHGLQCGFCTPGMLMSTYALLQKMLRQRKRRFAGEYPGISVAAPGIKILLRPFNTPPKRWRREESDGTAQDIS